MSDSKNKSSNSNRTSYWLSAALLALGIAGYVDLKLDVGRLEASTDLAPAADRWACDGSLGAPQVQQTVGQFGRGVFTCFETLRSRTPDARGSLTLELRVGSDGSVEDHRLMGELANDEEFAGCLENDLQSWRFAAPSGECAIVSVPFYLGANPSPQ